MFSGSCNASDNRVDERSVLGIDDADDDDVVTVAAEVAAVESDDEFDDDDDDDDASCSALADSNCAKPESIALLESAISLKQYVISSL